MEETSGSARGESKTGNNSDLAKSKRENEQGTQDQKNQFFQCNPSKVYMTHGGHRPPSLIFDWNKNKVLAHFYTTNVKMNLGSGKELHPL
jgi:hypothetical protein